MKEFVKNGSSYLAYCMFFNNLINLAYLVEIIKADLTDYDLIVFERDGDRLYIKTGKEL